MHDRPEFLRNVAADNEPPEAVFVPVAIQYLSIMKKIPDGALQGAFGYGTNCRPTL